MRGATVDKLLLSFSTLERHAPEVLRVTASPATSPASTPIEYFTRALGGDESPGPFRRLDAADDMIEQLRTRCSKKASVRELRERFNPVLNPKPSDESQSTCARPAPPPSN